MIERFATGEKPEIDEKEWEFLGLLEGNDSLFEEIDITAWVTDNWKE